jgi:hypothetical protein
MSFPEKAIGPRTILPPLITAVGGLILIRSVVPAQGDDGGLWPVFSLFALMITVVGCALWALSLEQNRLAVPEPTVCGFDNVSPSREGQLETKYALALTLVVAVGLLSLQVAESFESEQPTPPASPHPDTAASGIPFQGGV